jgi:hypothetical protein
MKKTVIKRRKRVPAAASKSAGGHSSGTDGKTTGTEPVDLSGAPYHPSLHAHNESHMQMTDRAAAEALVAVGRVRRHVNNGSDYSLTPHRVHSPDTWGDGEPKRKRQRKDIDGPVDDDNGDDVDMDMGHSRPPSRPSKRRESPTELARGVVADKHRPNLPPPPPSERLETTTLTLSSSSVGRGLSRSGTPAELSTRDSGFTHNITRAQSVPQPPSRPSQPTIPHSHSNPVYPNNRHSSHQHHSDSHSLISPVPLPRSSSPRLLNGHAHSIDARSSSPYPDTKQDPRSYDKKDPELRSNGWQQRQRFGANNVELPPLADIQANLDRDEESRRSSRPQNWNTRGGHEDNGITRNSMPMQSSPPPLIEASAQYSNNGHPSRTSSSSPPIHPRDERGVYVNGYSTRRTGASDDRPNGNVPPPLTSISRSHEHSYRHQAANNHSVSKHSHSASPEIPYHQNHSSHGHSHHRHHQPGQEQPPYSPQYPQQSRPSSRSSNTYPSLGELEAHYRELRMQKQVWEEMLDKTERLMDGIRRGIEEIKDRERDSLRRPTSSGMNGLPEPVSVPLPDRPNSGPRSAGKERVWTWTVNGVEKDH